MHSDDNRPARCLLRTGHRNGRLALAVLLACSLISSLAAADSHPSGEGDPDSRQNTGTMTEQTTQQTTQQEWEYDTDYIFPLTRHMSDSGLPMAGQIVLYPFAFLIDLGQWPFGALAGLAGK